ncbi:MAG TPA: hypothetical protein VHK27_05535 [Gammaproteobacteria bacterium]|nr:hypothetical protein [Gammaproteobacteria bacterium]
MQDQLRPYKREAVEIIKRKLAPDVRLAFEVAKRVQFRGPKTRPEEALLVIANAYAELLAKQIKPENRQYTLKDFL